MMQIELKTENSDLAGALQGYIEQRLSLAIGRLADQVGRVRVKASGKNGPRGGVRNTCRISMDFKPIGRIALQETDVDMHAAIDRAAARASRLIRQRLEKAQDSRFGEDPALAA
jgi:ribosome-associated translation inhibitor RaiA